MGRELTQNIDLSFCRIREVHHSTNRFVFEYGLSDKNDPQLIDADNNGKLLIGSFAIVVTCNNVQVKTYAALAGENGWYITGANRTSDRTREHGHVVITADEALLVD